MILRAAFWIGFVWLMLPDRPVVGLAPPASILALDKMAGRKELFPGRLVELRNDLKSHGTRSVAPRE